MFQPPSASVTALADKPSLETVKAAIKTVLSQDINVDRKPASNWLDAFRKSVYAWEICDQLILSKDSIEVSYLAAHMLRHKISTSFNELPLEYHTSLKNSILNHLQSNTDYAILGQLTMAIADLTLLVNNWQEPIEDLAKQLGLNANLMSFIVTMDYAAIAKALHNRLLFAYIIHQMCDLNHNQSERPARIGAKRREEFEDYLISKCSQAITWWLNTLKEISELKAIFATSTVKDENENTLKEMSVESMDKLTGQIYLCYSAWLRIFDEENVNESLPLVDAAFKHLNNLECSDHIHKYAVEVVVATANFCEDNRAVDYLVDHLVQQVYTLEPAFAQSIANEEVDKSSNFAKTFTSVAETAFSTHVIEQKHFRLLRLMLNCLKHYDFEVVEETYSFWWLFLECIQNRVKQSEYGPYIEYINEFVVSVTKLCQFDPDEDSVISHDQDIHGFRANSAEIIGNVMFITTVENFMRDNSILQNLIVETSWEKVEAILYLISCLVQMTTRDENNLMDQIFHCILRQQTKIQDLQSLLACDRLPIKIGIGQGETHPQVVATTLKIIGSLENFLADYPDYLILAINYILNSISDTRYRSGLMKYAATALSNIMESNAGRHLSGYPQLLVVVKDLCTNLDEFDEQAAGELLRCSAFMADAIKDLNVKDQFLCEIIRPILNSLKDTLKSNPSDIEIKKYMDRFSSVFKQASLHPSIVPEIKNFINLIDTELWPVIVEVLASGAKAGGGTIERTCRTIRFLIRCIKPEWMIERVADTMINLYKTYPQNSSPLYICSILVDEFANRSPEINQGLFAMLEIFCTLTFTLLNMSASQSKSLLTMKSYPETIDDMMRLFVRFMRKCPKDFVSCKALESIIELSISSLRIDHPDANQNVSRFVTSFISLGQTHEYPHISDAIRNVLGARFTDAVVRACLFDIPYGLIGEEAQILMALYSFDKDLFNTWIEATVSNLPKTNIQGIESVTPEQIEDFKRTITTAGSLKKIVSCLRAFARLYT